MTYIQTPLALPDKNKGYTCRCCGSYVKLYRRSFNKNMALCLLALLKHKVFDFVKVEDFLLEHGYKRCGDFSYLVHYRMLQKQEGKREDGSKRNGYYKLTSTGILFAERKLKVHEKFLISNNKFEGFDGEEIYINQVKKFNYDELMSS